MTSPSTVGSTTATTSSSASSITINSPTGSGSLLVCFLAAAADVGTWSAPAGWTQISGDARTTAWWAYDDSSPSWSFTTNVAVGRLSGGIVRITGAATSSPIDVSGFNTSSGTSAVANSITPANSADLLLAWFMASSGSGSFTAVPAGTTQQWAASATANGCAQLLAYLAPSGSPTGSQTATFSASTTTHNLLVAVKPAASSGNATVTASAVASATSLPAAGVGTGLTAGAVAATSSVPAATVRTGSGVQFVRTGGTAINNSTNSIVNLSSQVSDGNLLLFAIGANKGTQTTWTDPAGLTAVADDSSGANSSDTRTRTFTRLASGDAGGSYTFTSNVAVNHAQTYLEYSGVDATTPLASASVSTGHDATLLNGITTQANNALVVVVLTLEGSATVTTPPSAGSLSFTLRQTLATTSGSDDVTLYVYDAIQPTAGDTGNITWSGTPTNSTYQVFALRQAVAPFSTTVTPSPIASSSSVPFGQINQGVQPSALAATATVPTPTIVASGSLTNVSLAQGWYTATTGNTASGGTASVTLPSAPTQGNVLVIAANSDQPVTTPSGWTLADSLVNVSGLYLFTKTAGAAESSTVSVTFSGVGAIAVAELVAASGSLDAATGQVTRSSGSAPVSVSLSGPTGSADEYVVAVMGSISAAQLQWDGWTDGFTEQADTSTALTTGNNVSVAVADYDLQGPATYSVSASTYDRSTGALAGSAAQALLVAFKAIAGSATVRAQTARFTGRALDAAVVVPVDATVTASAIAAATSVPTVAPITPGSTVVPAQTVAAVGKVPTIASSTASSTVFVDTLSAPAAVVTPASVSGVGITAVTAATVSAPSSVPTPTVDVTSAVNATVPAQTIAATTTVPAVALTTGSSATVTPNAYAALAAVLAPSGLANSVTVAAKTIAALTAVSSGNTSITVPTYTFTPPTVFDVPQIAVGVNSPMNRLAMHMNAGERGLSVWALKDGTYTTQQPVYWEDVDHVFYGGHSYTVSAAEATTLEQYGFSVTEAVPQ